jgi:NTE family protein
MPRPGMLRLNLCRRRLDQAPQPGCCPDSRRSFETTHRRVQTSAYDRLHRYVEDGELAGFVLPYLGQQDDRLPFRPPDLIPRERVITYPTDFSAMSEDAINMLSLRGEQLIRLLVARYTPEL